MVQIDGATGMREWSYDATSEGVSEGRAFAVNAEGDGTVVVAGTTTGGVANPTGKDNMPERLNAKSRCCWFATFD